MDKNQGTSPTFHSQPASPSESLTTTDSEQIITGEQLSQQLQLKHTKSVHFLNTSTSTTTLPIKEPIKKLRTKLNTLLTCMIKQTRTTIKSRHHIKTLNTAIQKYIQLQESIENKKIYSIKLSSQKSPGNIQSLQFTKKLQWKHSSQ